MFPMKMAWPLFIIVALSVVLRPHPARAHIEKGYMPDAVAEMEYKILLEFEPDNIDARNKLGMILLRRGKLDEAEKEFNHIISSAPENFNAVDALGLILAEKKEHPQAIILFNRAIQLSPDDTLVYHHLGSSLEAMGNYTEAAKAYAMAVRNDNKEGSPDRKQTAELHDALKNINLLLKKSK